MRGRVRITVVHRHLPVDGLSYSGKCSTETASTEESVMSPARTKYVSRVRAVVGGLLLHAFMVDQGETQGRLRWGGFLGYSIPQYLGEDCVKRDLERVGGEWRISIRDRRNWRLLIENVMREIRGEGGKYEETMAVTTATSPLTTRGEQHCEVKIVFTHISDDYFNIYCDKFTVSKNGIHTHTTRY